VALDMKTNWMIPTQVTRMKSFMYFLSYTPGTFTIIFFGLNNLVSIDGELKTDEIARLETTSFIVRFECARAPRHYTWYMYVN
jgi:hypothetical protein